MTSNNQKPYYAAGYVSGELFEVWEVAKTARAAYDAAISRMKRYGYTQPRNVRVKQIEDWDYTRALSQIKIESWYYLCLAERPLSEKELNALLVPMEAA